MIYNSHARETQKNIENAFYCFIIIICCSLVATVELERRPQTLCYQSSSRTVRRKKRKRDEKFDNLEIIFKRKNRLNRSPLKDIDCQMYCRTRLHSCNLWRRLLELASACASLTIKFFMKLMNRNDGNLYVTKNAK